MKNVLNLLAILFFLTISMGTQCNKELAYDPTKKPDFAEKAQITPSKKTYSIGDTLWLTFITQDKSLYDAISNQRLPSSMVKFRFGATLFSLYDTPQNVSGSVFEFLVPANASLSINSTVYNSSAYWYLDCDNNPTYNIQLGIIPKYQGIYLMEVSFYKSEIEACVNQTNPYPNSNIHFTFDVPDTNKDVYLSIPSSKRTDQTIEGQIDSKAVYVIKVQ